MSRCILIVDDEENHRRSLSIGLRLDGWSVLEAEDGEAALRVLDAHAVDVAIVDLMMPGINGLDLARRLRFRYPATRVVLTSAYHLSERQIERAAVGAVAFLPKPYRLDDLSEFLREKFETPPTAASA